MFGSVFDSGKTPLWSRSLYGAPKESFEIACYFQFRYIMDKKGKREIQGVILTDEGAQSSVAKKTKY